MNFHIHFPEPFTLNVNHVDSQAQSQILERLASLMATAAELQEKIDAINTNSNDLAAEVARIAGVLQSLRDQIAGGLTPEEGAALASKLDEAIANSQAVEDAARALGT